MRHRHTERRLGTVATPSATSRFAPTVHREEAGALAASLGVAVRTYGVASVQLNRTYGRPGTPRQIHPVQTRDEDT